ncbi:MAG: 6-hydroxypseudooxynicotine dehydrogenase complex subunit gamma [Pseudomonadota bacterium]|jgi:CO/xanthine dehydrogenase Mo-binding subunit
MKSSDPHIGRSLPRLEDPPLVRGEAQFVADLFMPHMLHMRVVRSPVAHAGIRTIDCDAARALKGVVAVWTGEDLADLGPIPFRRTRLKGLEPYRQPALARGCVRYVGEPVVAVFATDPAVAEDASDLVLVEYQDRPVITDARQSPGDFSADRSTEPAVLEKGYGEVDAAFEGAAYQVELELDVGRHSGVPMETRGLLAHYDRAKDHLCLYGAAKRPHWNRDQLAEIFKRPPSSIDLAENHVGGGFGVRGELYPEDLLVCRAALMLGRPVKWVEDRREHLMATNHSRQQHHRIRAAVDREGRLLAIDSLVFHDQGAYVRTHGARVADMTIGLLLGPYKVPAYRARLHYRLTNKTPAATYRSPGRFEGSFVRERLMDAVARKVGLDPIIVRQRNLVTRDEMPYARPLDALDTEVVLDSGDYALLLSKALNTFGWEKAQAQVLARKLKGERVGLGLALFVEKSGLGPVDGVRIAVDSSGQVEVVTGAASVGQGVETVLAQICADALGVDYRCITVVHGQTSRIEHGFGAHASRVTVMTGEATRIAATRVRERALATAAARLGTPVETLDLRGGTVWRRSIEDDSFSPTEFTLGRLAAELVPSVRVAQGEMPGLGADGWFVSEHMNYPYGVHIALARVDEDTGGVQLERYLVAYDVGRAINPMLVEGQLQGGLAQGIGGALFEEFRYDEQGQPLSLTLADYMMPTAREMPEVSILITEDAPSPLNPLGVKGAGEGGVTAAGAAIAAAIDDAIDRPGAIRALPITPMMIRRIFRSAQEPQT